MGIIKGIHHIEIYTKSLSSVSQCFINLGFKPIWSKEDECVLRSGSAIFIVKSFPDSNISNIDTVFDVALEVSNVEDVINYSKENHIPIIKMHERISDHLGFIDIAQIKSCIGNVVHTLINKNNYRGIFLPGYSIKLEQNETNFLIKRFDHITYAVRVNSSCDIIKWYSNVFRMKRVLVNKDDLIDDGFVFQHKTGGMRLKAFEYWKCDENCISNNDDTCKFIIAEELNRNVENQIGMFLKEHESPGIQHIGLFVDNIVEAANSGQINNIPFIQPPARYYEIIKLNPKMMNADFSLNPFEKHGILIDVESEPQSAGDICKDGYLFQIFTKPIFDRDSFFLELIERRGAKGFGSGNIKALFDAVDNTYSVHGSVDLISLNVI